MTAHVLLLLLGVAAATATSEPEIDLPAPGQIQTQITGVIRRFKPDCVDGSRWRVACNWCTCEGGVSHCTEAGCADWDEDMAREEGVLECHGSSRWKKDCNWCNCRGGHGFCTKIGCLPREREPFRGLPKTAVCVPGSQWMEECNSCSCGKTGNAMCTMMGCEPGSGSKDDGQPCQEGSVWRYDCNVCRCVEGLSACTKRLCRPEPPPPPPQIPQCQAGDPKTNRWRKDCNWCSCRNGVEACTRRLCPQGVEDEEPQCEGKATWMKECNRCSCANGTAVCTLKFCGASPARPTLLRGRPEPACQGDSKTDTWTFKCNKCRCRNGLATCTKRLCRRGEKDLPVCQGNPIWRKDCNRCHCHNGTAVCTSKYCGPMASQTRTAVRPPGLVSKDKRVCEDGSRWRVDCNWCSCRGGVALCTLKGCLRPSDEPDCEGDATWKQDCNWCTCGGGLALCTRMACLKEGKEPCIEGTSWRHECNLCHCSNGFTRCTKIACAKPGCHGESCVDRPLPALCHLPPMTGSLKCMAFMPKWSFSKEEGRCQQIVYGGCGGTENLFDLAEECQAACPSTTPTITITTTQTKRTFGITTTGSGGGEECHLAKESGPCYAELRRYAYNTETGRCEAFTYGGCEGNGNNFETEEACLTACQGTQVAVCDKSRCPWPLWAHYLAKQCVPQYKGDACCPTSFHCPSASESGRDTTKCHYKGVAYSAGDSVPVQDDCSADCRCLQPSDASSPPEITCANVECPELFRPPRPGCRLLFRQGQCCAYDEECEEPGAPPLQPRAATCSWQNKTYQEGSKMSFNDQPCQSCICGPGFTNPSGPGCSKVACGLDFRYKSELHRGCAPIHFETKRCCHIDWLCPGSNNIKPQQQQQQQPGTADESSVCHLGDRRLAVGETLALTDCKIDCRCLTPPELTCIQYRSCELAQQTAAERACPPLHCEPGCRPVVGDSGLCPKCSCSPDTFSCPAQTCPTHCQPELDLQTGCPTCKCQCPAVVCPIACPSHTVLDEPTGCPRCVCKPGSPRDHEACPLYPGGVVPCPQDCAVIKRKDENGCEVCECDPNDPGNPFGRPLPRDPSSCRGEGQAPCPMDCAIIREKDRDGCEVCKCDPNDPGNPFGRPLPREPSSCHGEGQAPCPMDCAIIREKDRDGCEVCKCDPDNPGHPFGRPLPRDPSSCHGEGQAPCPMDCAIIREKDRDGCEVCKCDPDNPGHPFGRPMPRDPSSCRGEGQAPCPMDCAIIREKDRDGCEVCKCDPDNPGHPFGRPLPREPRSCHGEGQAPCPMDCAIIREKDRDGCEICKCDPDNPGHPFGPHPLPPQFRVRRSCPGKEEAPCPMDCGVIRYPDSNGCWVCKCDPDNPGNPFGPFIPPPGRHW